MEHDAGGVKTVVRTGLSVGPAKAVVGAGAPVAMPIAKEGVGLVISRAVQRTEKGAQKMRRWRADLCQIAHLYIMSQKDTRLQS